MKKIILFVILIAGVISCKEKAGSEIDFDPAFVHSVYIWLKNPDSPEDRAAFEASTEKFMERSLYARTKFLGTPPKATREIVDDTYTYNLIVTFASAADQDKYQTEKAHLEFIEESNHLWNKIVIYDALGLPGE
jgi:hypothetical protein